MLKFRKNLASGIDLPISLTQLANLNLPIQLKVWSFRFLALC